MMEQPNELVSAPKKESVKTPHRYILQEIENDISVFPEDVRDIINKLSDGQRLAKKEQSVFDVARNAWWINKYGFPYTQKAARNEVIMRKYAQPDEIAKTRTLQEKFLAAYQAKDEEAITNLKHEYEEKYPDQLEGVEILFGFDRYLKEQGAIKIHRQRKPRESFAELRETFQSLTEFNFMITDFISNNSGDKKFLKKFWDILELMSSKRGRLDQFHMLQRGTVTQVATQKLFEQIGLNPKLSHPAEDAFHAIDLWVDTAAVQIKGAPRKDAVFLETDTIAFPGIRANKETKKEQAKIYHINSYMFQEAQRFHARLSKYRQFMQKDVKGYFIIIPHHKIDFITGEPAPDLVQLVRDRVKTELK